MAFHLARKNRTWITAREAGSILEIPADLVSKLGRQGVITRRQLPGQRRPRYSRTDVEALGRSSIIPAQAELRSPALAEGDAA